MHFNSTGDPLQKCSLDTPTWTYADQDLLHLVQAAPGVCRPPPWFDTSVQEGVKNAVRGGELGWIMAKCALADEEVSR